MMVTVMGMVMEMLMLMLMFIVMVIVMVMVLVMVMASSKLTSRSFKLFHHERDGIFWLFNSKFLHEITKEFPNVMLVKVITGDIEKAILHSFVLHDSILG